MRTRRSEEASGQARVRLPLPCSPVTLVPSALRSPTPPQQLGLVGHCHSFYLLHLTPQTHHRDYSMKAKDLLELLDGRLGLAFQVLAAVLKVKGYEPELYLGIFKCILGLTAPDAYFQDDDVGDGEEIALGAFSDKISDVMHMLLSTDFPAVIVDAAQRCCGFKEPRRRSKRAPTLEARYALAQGPVGKSAGSAARVKANGVGHEIVAVVCQFMECGGLGELLVPYDMMQCDAIHLGRGLAVYALPYSVLLCSALLCSALLRSAL